MDALLERIPWTALQEWQAFAELEPFGPLEDERRAGTVAAFVANWSGRLKNPRDPLTASDVMPALVEPEREQTAEEQIALVRTMFGGKNRR